MECRCLRLATRLGFVKIKFKIINFTLELKPLETLLFHERAKIAKKALLAQPEYTYQEMLEIQKTIKAKAKPKMKKKVKEEKSPYNPEFVKKILRAEKRADYLEINPKNVQESLGLKKKTPVKKAKK